MADRQSVYTSGWWAGYRVGRIDEQEGVEQGERIAPKLPPELQHGRRLEKIGERFGNVIGGGLVLAAIVIAAIFAVGILVLAVRVLLWAFFGGSW